jgi:hypothetical protein
MHIKLLSKHMKKWDHPAEPDAVGGDNIKLDPKEIL